MEIKDWDIEMIKDLLNPTDHIRRAGRTSAIIKAYIELAKENPDFKIPLHDHFPTERATRSMIHDLEEEVYKSNKILEDGFYKSRFLLKIDNINRNSMVLIYTHHPESYDPDLKTRDIIK